MYCEVGTREVIPKIRVGRRLHQFGGWPILALLSDAIGLNIAIR
jgi:hypothetical protein